MSKELWVIEAPGKARLLEDILRGLRVDAVVQATKGHFMQMPQSLSPLGIDKSFQEFERKPRDPEVLSWMRRKAEGCDRLVIATDADAEGDAIAWDVAELLSDLFPEPMRVRLRGMDDESVEDAIREAQPVRKADAIPARTRAIVDRMIGATFSRDGVAVGRVGTALLGLVASQKPSTMQLNLSCPAKDGGRPWLAETPVVPPLTEAIAKQLVQLALPPLDFQSSNPLITPPANMGDIMVRAADRLDISVGQSAKSLQRMYEAGKMSYPRAGSRGISRSTSRKLAKILKEAGYDVDGEKIQEKPPEAVHDAPYPIGRVNIAADPRKLGDDEGLRTMVARDLVKTGQKHTVERPHTAALEKFLATRGFPPEVITFVAKLNWRREHGPQYPGRENWSQNKISHRRPDAVLLEAAMQMGLGRPSTWANHIETFLSRGLVDETLQLTAKGEAWMRTAPRALLDPKVSAAIESACERIDVIDHTPPGREPWEFLAQRIVQVLPPELKGPLLQGVVDEPVRERVDIKTYIPVQSPAPTNESGLDFDEMAREKSPAYRPSDY